MIASRSNRGSLRRPGFGLIEMAVTGALLLVAMTVTVQAVGRIALERKAVERRERALLEAENLLERIVARPWDDLTSESANQSRISSTTAGFLPSSNLAVRMTNFDDAPPRKQVAVEIRWLDRSGRPEAPIRLVAWIYKRTEGGR